MACATAGRWLLRCHAESGVDLRFVRVRKSGVVSVRQGTPTGYDTTICRVADGLELPQPANRFQVADVFSVSRKNPVNLIVGFEQRERVQTRSNWVKRG